MNEFDILIEKVAKLNADNSNHINIQGEYRNILVELSRLLSQIPCEKYRTLCEIRRSFVNQQDLSYPASRLSLVRSSINYILNMMEIVWANLSKDEEQIEELKKDLYSKYGYTQEDYFRYFIKVDRIKERKTIENLFSKFSFIHDKFNEREDSSSIIIFNIAYEIIINLMSYYLSSETTVNLLKDWERMQEIIFPFDEEYRDHLIHQFYVFLLGANILSKLEKRIIENWKTFDDRDDPEIKRRTFRAWISASIFHDLGYIATKYKEIGDRVFKQFFSDLHGVQGQQFKIKINPRNEKFSEYLNLMEKVFLLNEFRYYREERTNDRAIKIENAINNEMEHGSLTSYIFWNTIQYDIKNIRLNPIESMKASMSTNAYLSSIQHDEKTSHEARTLIVKANDIDIIRDNEFKNEVLEDIDIASFAIALHKLSSYTKINFLTHPITFLLILCDELQQWGRISFKNQKPVTKPNEFIECKVFLKIDDDVEFIDYLKLFGNIDQYSNLLSSDAIGNSIEEKIVNKISSDVIVIRFAKIEDNYLEKFKKEFKNLFSNRLQNGPSLIVTNLKDGIESIFFMARNIEGKNKYELCII